MKISRQVGTTGEVLGIYIQDATVSTGAGLANVIASTLNFSWIRNNQAAFSTGTATSAATTGTYSTNGLTQVHSSQAKGLYHFCPPDGLFASGDSSLLFLYGTTGTAATMAPLAIEIELTKTNNQQYASSTVYSSTNIVQSVTGLVGVSTVTGTTNVNLLQVYSSPVVTTSAGTLGVTATTTVGLVGVSSMTIGVNVTSVNGSAIVTTSAGVVSAGLTGLVGVSTITVGVNASTVSGLAGVSTLTVGVNASTVSGLSGVSTIAANAINFAAYSTDSYPLMGVVDAGTAQSTTANTIQLRSGLVVTSTNIYNGHTIYAYGATSGAGESRLVTSWSATTAGVDTWDQTPATSTKYVVYATPPGSLSSPANVNLTQIYGSPAVTTSAGTLGVANSGLVGVSTITVAVNASTVSGLVGVSTITVGVNSTTNSGAVNLTQIYGSPAVTTSAGTLGVTATTTVGLVGVSSMTIGVNVTSIQGSNAVTTSPGTLGVSATTVVGLVGVSSMTIGVNVTSIQGSAAVTTSAGVLSAGLTGLVGVSTVTVGVNASTVSGLVGVSTIAAAAQAALANTILTTTQAESYRTVNAPGSVIQLMYEATAHLGDFANVGTTKTLHSVTSHTGNVATYGYDSSTSPSSITRTS